MFVMSSPPYCLVSFHTLADPPACRAAGLAQREVFSRCHLCAAADISDISEQSSSRQRRHNGLCKFRPHLRKRLYRRLLDSTQGCFYVRPAGLVAQHCEELTIGRNNSTLRQTRNRNLRNRWYVKANGSPANSRNPVRHSDTDSVDLADHPVQRPDNDIQCSCQTHLQS